MLIFEPRSQKFPLLATTDFAANNTTLEKVSPYPLSSDKKLNL
ncbi:hypothetical protein HMPREF1557_01795 [Streptococcus sobrinus W1703]|uniref:Uncharacterized protein n=1 Tax=Streptococcus sobrinus W1703 TaxID=1227275 RepID=U2J3A3_9STRE|nr:hypothetical protein HMPREF1557_01795 [Streptococcus sobrinus W1703]